MKKSVVIVILVALTICTLTFTVLAAGGFLSINSQATATGETNLTPDTSPTSGESSLTPVTAQTNDEANLNDAIFERDGSAYRYYGETGQIKKINATCKPELPIYSPTLSPDNTRVAYRHSIFDTPENALMVGVMDMKGNIICEITLQTTHSNEIIGLAWIDNNKIGVTGHVNPSTSEYFIFDAENGEELSRYVGGPFVPLPDGSILYEENVPHGFGHLAYHSLILNDKVIYTAAEPGVTFSDIAFSFDGRTIAFVLYPTYVDERHVPIKFVIAQYDYESLMYEPLYESEIPSGIKGCLAFDEQDNVCFIETGFKHTFSAQNKSFTSDAVIIDKCESDRNAKQYENLQNSVFEYFGDKTLKNISHLTWIKDTEDLENSAK